MQRHWGRRCGLDVHGGLGRVVGCDVRRYDLAKDEKMVKWALLPNDEQRPRRQWKRWIRKQRWWIGLCEGRTVLWMQAPTWMRVRCRRRTKKDEGVRRMERGQESARSMDRGTGAAQRYGDWWLMWEHRREDRGQTEWQKVAVRRCSGRQGG